MVGRDFQFISFPGRKARQIVVGPCQSCPVQVPVPLSARASFLLPARLVFSMNSPYLG